MENTWYVYRVQNLDELGPYRGGLIPDQWMDGPHSQKNGRPSPFYDEGFDSISFLDVTNRICGFMDLRQLQAWFTPDELRKLDRLGFRPVRVRARKIIELMHQVVFHAVAL